MKKKYLIGNLKMNLSSKEEANQYLSVLKREAAGKRFDHVDIVIAPPCVFLDRFQHELPQRIALGSQNVFWEKEGSYTGEISVLMLKDAGVEYVIVGHSERRLYGKESDEEIAKKVRMVLRSNLRPVLCIGESADDREKDRTAGVIEKQLESSFRDLSALQAERVLVAYEPRWAIGTDRTPNAEEILQAKVIIYRTIAELCGSSTAERVPVLYGGSVKTAILDEICFSAQMDGVLVGRESLFPYEVVKMAERIEAHETEVLTGNETDADKK